MASSVKDDALGHLTHVKDIAHEDPQFRELSVDLLNDFHQHRMGKTPEGFGATLKHDGGASVHIIHDNKGIGITDKHRAKRGIVARTEKDIDKHFGHAPDYAAGLKHLLKHGKSLVEKGKTVQGDLLFTPGDKTTHKKDDTTEYTPNRITYHAKTKAPIGLAVHTEITNGVAHGLSKNAIKETPHIFVPHHDYSKPDPATYSYEDRKNTEHHLHQARLLLSGHSTEHLTPEHIPHFTIYNNRTTRSGTTPTVSGYVEHLKNERDKAASKLKSEKGKTGVNDSFNNLISHAQKNKSAFKRSLDIRHHLEQATESVLRGVSHPDLQTSIDGKPSPGEGVVLQRKDEQGRMRPIGKLVPKPVSHALLNNPRFGRQAIQEMIQKIRNL